MDARPRCAGDRRGTGVRHPPGHEVLGQALDWRPSASLGHRGANHPVLALQSGKVLVTAKSRPSLSRADHGNGLSCDFGAGRSTDASLYDGTVEVRAGRTVPMSSSMQFDP